MRNETLDGLRDPDHLPQMPRPSTNPDQLDFALLREGGGFGFIVSDTFFTLSTKQRMRALLQRHRLTHLGQCDPFDATVDAAIFVAQKNPAEFSGDADSADETGRVGVPPAVSRVSRKTSNVENAPQRDTPSANEPDSTRDGPRGTRGPAGGTPTLPDDATF